MKNYSNNTYNAKSELSKIRKNDLNLIYKIIDTRNFIAHGSANEDTPHKVKNIIQNDLQRVFNVAYMALYKENALTYDQRDVIAQLELPSKKRIEPEPFELFSIKGLAVGILALFGLYAASKDMLGK